MDSNSVYSLYVVQKPVYSAGPVSVQVMRSL